MTSGGRDLVFGYTIISTLLRATTIGWECGGQIKIRALWQATSSTLSMRMVVWCFFTINISSGLINKSAIPLTTQSDPGSENYGVANVQTHARHKLDPSLAGTLQHWWKCKKNNVKSEANWSIFRQDFAPGFEDLFELGVNQGWYDVDKPLEKYINYCHNYLDLWLIYGP